MITIIAILITLLLPAVQAAREAARQLQCKNHLKQLSLAALNHEQVHRFLPTGGWGWGWVGDPDRGFDKRQPGGWFFNILPYMELETLRNLGANNNAAGQLQTVETPIATFHCPTRRRAIGYLFVHTPVNGVFFENCGKPTLIGRNDYAACGGDVNVTAYLTPWGPRSYAIGDTMTEAEWDAMAGRGCSPMGATGVVYVRSMCKMSDIIDGTSFTYSFGEKYLNPDRYADGKDTADDLGWNLGFDIDNARWTNTDVGFRPSQDQPGVSNPKPFGSAHANGFHMSFCDGSVQIVSYNIDPAVHACLGNRKDGKMIDSKQF